jgi:hypothetical protein
MTLRLALCFLFHQPLSEQAERAGRICYRNLLGVLRNHTRCKFNLMISGTLLDALGWFDPAFLEDVRAGLAAGQFRLLGSTHAQTLLLAADESDSARQIAVHRGILKQLFDAEPESFWSPQRTWAPHLAPLLARAGYRRLPLESGALRAAGAGEPRPFWLHSPESALSVLWEDAGLRDRIDFAAWFHRPESPADLLDGWARRPDADRLFPVFAEDADAFGLRGYDEGLDPRSDAAGLDALLDWIGRREDVDLAFCDEAPEPETTLALDGPVRGRALDRALTDPEFSPHEEGYRDWDEFLARAPRLQHFRRMHYAARVRLAASEAAVGRSGDTAPAAALMSLADRVFSAHQDRFGAVGVGARGDPAWEGIGAAIAIAKAAELAGTPPRPGGGALIDDLTGDGEDEILLRNGEQLALLSPYGGRLLEWIDLRRGQLLVGNPLAVPSGTLLIEARSPEFAPLPDDWLPREDDPIADPIPDGGRRRLVNLDAEGIAGAGGPLPAWPRPRATGLRPALPARRRALNDFFSLDDGPEEKSEPRLDFRLADGAVVFLRFFGYRLRLVKRISLTARGVRAIYRLRNVNGKPLRVRLRLVSEVCPDYRAVVETPGRTLEPAAVGPRHSPGVKNTFTGNILVSHVSRPAAEPAVNRPGILAYELEQTVAFTVEPGATETLVVRLDLTSEAESAKKPAKTGGDRFDKPASGGVADPVQERK